jgi:hypothetical protein
VFKLATISGADDTSFPIKRVEGWDVAEREGAISSLTSR